MLVEVILFVLIITLIIYLSTKENLPDNVPKGPRRIPWLGTVGSFENIIYLSDMRRARDKYGDIFMTKVGTQYMVFLCNYQLVKEAFGSPHVTDRPAFQFMYFFSDGVPAGVAFTSGEHWISLRRFLLRQMREHGMGKSYMEDAIMHEGRKLVKEFGKLEGKPANFPNSIDISVLNIVWQLIAGKAYDYDDPKILDLMDMVHQLNSDLSSLVLPDLFPILKYLPNFIRNQFVNDQVLHVFKKRFINFTKGEINEHKANLDPEDPRDVIDHYLIDMEEEKKNPDGPQFKSDVDLTTAMANLFAAGSDTTSQTIQWLILYTAAHPEVQKKLHDEIDAVIDFDEEISLDHKESLPYLEATIQETHRFASLVIGGVPHQASKNIQLGGHTVPKGAWVYACQALCHEDPNYWKEPEKFQPERYIDENGKFKPQKESFMPFGIGRRQCLGEALARMELYFFSAQLLQKFHFAPQEGCTIDLEPKKYPMARFPKKQKIVITARNTKREK